MQTSVAVTDCTRRITGVVAWLYFSADAAAPVHEKLFKKDTNIQSVIRRRLFLLSSIVLFDIFVNNKMSY